MQSKYKRFCLRNKNTKKFSTDGHCRRHKRAACDALMSCIASSRDKLHSLVQHYYVHIPFVNSIIE